MGAFLQALSALAPVAPAMSDARDLRTQREQEEAQFGQETELRKAQLTAQQFAAQAEQQRILKDSTVRDLGWNPVAQSDQVLIQDPRDGTFRAQNTPGGMDPSARYKHTVDEFKAATKRDPTPDENQQLLMSAYGMTGSALGRSSPKPVTLKGPNGDPVGASFINGTYYDADGKVIDNPVLWEKPAAAPKPGSPASQFLSLYTKKLLADSKQGPPLTPEESAQLIASKVAMDEPGVSRMEALGQQYARYHVMPVTNDDGSVNVIPVSSILSAAQSGQPYSAAVVGAPTGMDKKNQMLAQSAIMQVRRMKNILRTDPSLTGPGAGQLTQLQTFLGTQDPDAQQFIISGLLGSEHGVAVFGGRNIHTINDLNNALGNLKTNPDALTAALNVIEETMTPWLTAGGRLPGPKNGGSSPANASKNTIALKASGKVYNIPRDQVADFKKDHPDATQ